MHPMSVLLGQFLILLFSIVSVNGVPTPPFPLPASLSSQASSSTSTASSWNGSVSASTTSSIELVNDNTAIPTASLSANPSYSTLLINGGKLPAKHWHGWDKVEKLFVFGASYTSTGFNWLNGNQPSLADPLGNSLRGGRVADVAINGPNFIEYMALKYNSSAILSYDFAFSGATVNMTATLQPAANTNDLVHQISDDFRPNYLPPQTSTPSTIPQKHWTGDTTLFLSFFGINDIGYAYKASDPQSIISADFASYQQNIESLYTSGARNFLALNVPPIDLSPLYNTNPSNAKLVASATSDFNSRFAALADALNAKYGSEIGFWYFDTHALFSRILAGPGSRFRNTTGYCEAYLQDALDSSGKGGGAAEMGLLEPKTKKKECGGGVRLDEYFWFDGLHPTWPVHKVLAQEIVMGLKGLGRR
ncbi:MAG: hypothetical protein Q9190_006328, partial [Brigantiaea leucoxantha]